MFSVPAHGKYYRNKRKPLKEELKMKENKFNMRDNSTKAMLQRNYDFLILPVRHLPEAEKSVFGNMNHHITKTRSQGTLSI